MNMHESREVLFKNVGSVYAGLIYEWFIQEVSPGTPKEGHISDIIRLRKYFFGFQDKRNRA